MPAGMTGLALPFRGTNRSLHVGARQEPQRVGEVGAMRQISFLRFNPQRAADELQARCDCRCCTDGLSRPAILLEDGECSMPGDVCDCQRTDPVQ
jgi:hypothetical protein